jgi:hypothetical protein
MRDAAIVSFVQASRDFIARVDEALERLLRAADQPLTLLQLIDLSNPLLGPFGFPPDLAFALEAHLTWFEQTKLVQRLTVDGRAAWRWLEA